MHNKNNRFLTLPAYRKNFRSAGRFGMTSLCVGDGSVFGLKPENALALNVSLSFRMEQSEMRNLSHQPAYAETKLRLRAGRLGKMSNHCKLPIVNCQFDYA